VTTITARGAFVLTGLYGLAAVLPKAIGFVALMWVAKVLTVNDYALFGMLYAIQAGLGMVALAGISEVVVARSSAKATDLKELYTAANSAFIVMLVAWCVLGALALATTGRLEQGVNAIAAAVGGFGLGFATLQSQMLRLEERHYPAIWVQFAASSASFLGGGLFFFVQPSVISFFTGASAAILATLAWLAFRNIGHYRLTANPVAVRPILLGIPPFILIGVLGWLNGYGNNYIIGSLLTLRDVADFTFLLSLSATIQIVGSSLNQVWSPRFYRLYQAGELVEMERLSGKAFRVSALAMGMATAVLLLLYKPLIDLIGGNLIAYREKTLELALMSASYLAVIPLWHCQNYFVASGRSKDMLRSTLIGTTIGFGAWIGMVVWLGSIGVFAGYLVQAAVRSCVVLLVARRFWHIRVSWGGILLGLALLCASLL
jgi:O-antigen/teichoic acid export membrane protein